MHGGEDCTAIMKYDGAVSEFRDICNYWHAENMGVVTAKIDEQKTDATKQKIVELVAKL